ncbi:MAG: ABC transporter ATP-binding protein [Candidatus Melainabacteria bacterium]
MNDTTPAIAVQGVSKAYHSTQGSRRTVQALNNVSFDVPMGRVFTILGPNGAGKTTLMKIITTLTHPDAGTVKVHGHDVLRDTMAVRGLIGVVAQENNFDKYLTVWHNLSLHAELHGLRRAEYEPRLRELLQQVDLDDRRMDFADEFSGGMKRRVALIRALIHRPKVLFLDEPTTGLDPKARRDLWEVINTLKHQATIVLTTHYMDEADVLSDEILMVNHGEVVMHGTPQAIKKARSPKHSVDVLLNGPLAENYRSKLSQAGFTDLSVLASGELRVQLEAGQTLASLVGLFAPDDLHGISETEVDLESIYLEMARQFATQRRGA